MQNRFRDFLLGSPLPTSKLGENRLNKIRALAAFSPDALSSLAYANQEIYLGLMVAGVSGLQLAFPIGLAIVALLAIVSLSYAQTISGYPSGGGSYVVARENLGTIPGLIAAGALLISYVLTAAVSLTAGVEAIASAIPFFWSFKVELALGILVLLALVNLRGQRESGTLMAIPVYLFLFAYLPMLIFGLIQLMQNGATPLASNAIPNLQPLTLILILHAFASGCTALTGIESISNGIPAFKPPEVQNAQRTLMIMAILMGILFIGSLGLTHFFGIVAQPNETILSALARHILGTGPIYYLIQILTLLILAVAANTSFAGFPRVAAILAKDKFLPRQLTNLGDRLVFSNGIIVLSVATAILIIAFKGNSHSLVPLFAIGAFLAFTFSQAGMVVHWIRLRKGGWLLKSVINGIGALVTGASAVIIGFTKFTQGAWISILLIPAIVMVLLAIRRHYSEVAKELSMRGLPPSLKPLPAPRVVIPVSSVHQGIVGAVSFAQSMSAHITALFVEVELGTSEQLQKVWKEWWPDIELRIVPSPYRSIIGPLIDFLDQTDLEHNDGQQAVLIMPEFIPAKWWQGFLHNQSAWLIRMALLYRKRLTGFQRVIIDIPYHLKS